MSEQNIPEVSIVMPLYNKEAYLSRGLKSVLDQTEQRFELIVVDDASTDRSYDMASEAPLHDQRIRVIHLNHNIGPYAARRIGVQEAKADKICFIDGDDWYEPEAISTLKLLMDESEADMVQMQLRQRLGMLHSRTIEIPDSSLYNRLISGEEYRSLIRYIGLDSVVTPSCCNKIYRRDLLLRALDHKCTNRWGEDQIMNIHYTREGRSIYMTDYCGYNYRWHSEPGVYRYNSIIDYKEIHRVKALLGQDEELIKIELKTLWDYHVRQMLTELGWTREGAIMVLRDELKDPIWQSVGVTETAEETVNRLSQDIRENPIKYMVKRFLR